MKLLNLSCSSVSLSMWAFLFQFHFSYQLRVILKLFLLVINFSSYFQDFSLTIFILNYEIICNLIN